ncbi:hypothetical protein E5D57_011880 [Metarhizium anisopliae]|nr:hypothetical protein E5D57_011880 [Metarhizium anisopliae]
MNGPGIMGPSRVLVSPAWDYLRSPFEHGLKGIRGCLCDLILSRVAWSGVPGLLAGIGTGYGARLVSATANCRRVDKEFAWLQLYLLCTLDEVA